MNDFLTVEPAPELASRFAVWCLGRDVQVQTVSGGGFLVPLDWYADIPAELLDGAYVDGFLVEAPEPLAPAAEAVTDPPAAETRPPRKRANRKRSTDDRKSAEPSGVAAMSLDEFAASGSDGDAGA